MERPGNPQLLKGHRNTQLLRHFGPMTPCTLPFPVVEAPQTWGRPWGEFLGAQGLTRSCDLMESPGLGRCGSCLYHCCSSWFLCSSPEPWAGAFGLEGASVSSSLAGLGPLLSLGQSQRSGAGGHWQHLWEAGLPWLAGGSCPSFCTPKHCSGDGRTERTVLSLARTVPMVRWTMELPGPVCSAVIAVLCLWCQRELSQSQGGTARDQLLVSPWEWGGVSRLSAGLQCGSALPMAGQPQG